MFLWIYRSKVVLKARIVLWVSNKKTQVLKKHSAQEDLVKEIMMLQESYSVEAGGEPIMVYYCNGFFGIASVDAMLDKL